jgi:hypothetical protein
MPLSELKSKTPLYSLSIPTIYSRPLAVWQKSRHPTRIFRLFQYLGPILYQQYYETQNIKPAISNLADLTLNGTLIRLQRCLYHHQKQTLLLDHITNPTPNYEAALPSLLSPLTTLLPLTSLACQKKDTHIPNDLFTIALQQKLQLPLYQDLFKPLLVPTATKYSTLMVTNSSPVTYFPKLQSTTTYAMHYSPFAKLLALSLALPSLASQFCHMILSLNLQTFFLTILSIDLMMLYYIFTPPQQQTLVKLLPLMSPPVTGNPPLATTPLQSWPTNQPTSLHQVHL